MKKTMCVFMAVLMAFSLLTGCSARETTAGIPKGKVVINFEGTVTAVDGNEITLENGKVVVLSDDTVFAGDPDTDNAVSSDIAVGNFIQGFTGGDPDADRVSADKIYYNKAK